MTEDTNTNDTTGAGDDGQENDLIRSLRSQIEQAKAEAKAERLASASAVEAVRAEVARTSKAQEIVNALGFPKIAGIVAEKVEGELTEESVKGFLASVGLAERQVDDTSGETSQPEGGPSAQSIQQVADLSRSVADAASGDQAQDLAARIAAAESPEAVEALAAEGGFLQ